VRGEHQESLIRKVGESEGRERTKKFVIERRRKEDEKKY